MARATESTPEHAVLVDRVLDDHIDIDVDALCVGAEVYLGGIMEHIEEAGVHSGDSACVLPPYKLTLYHLSIMHDYTQRLDLALGTRGPSNAQSGLTDATGDGTQARAAGPRTDESAGTKIPEGAIE